MRVALLTLESLASAAPVRRFVASYPDRIAMVALSDPHAPRRGGMITQALGFLRRSGPGLLPYLTANFELPRIAGALPHRAASVERTRMRVLCARLGVPVELVADMNDPAFHARLRASGAELLLSFHCDQILTEATITCLPRGGWNVHAGLLPDQRGPVPTIHALLAETPAFGVTIHRLVARIDAGPILAQRRLELPAGTSALAAATRLHEAAIPMLADLLDALGRGPVAEVAATPKAYCGFPSAAQLRRLAGMGRRAATWGDMLRALRTPV
jgi:methionyl-tRNA formyltransferase